jgi:hypothetical protein
MVDVIPRWMGHFDQPSMVGLMYLAIGDDDTCFEWLEKAIDQHDGSLPSAMLDPLFDSVRSSPRYKAIRRRMNLE